MHDRFPRPSDHAALGLLALPADVVQLCLLHQARPRLVAHLTLVHDVAAQLVDKVASTWPGLRFEADAVLFGAATHDIGKALVPSELVQPGSEHEAKGRDLLRGAGVPDHLARFATTHASWSVDEHVDIEDLLVALADKVWKGKRDDELERRVVARIAGATGMESWEVFAELDGVLEELSTQADERLRWQAQFTA